MWHAVCWRDRTAIQQTHEWSSKLHLQARHPRKSSFEITWARPNWYQKPYHHYHRPQRGLVKGRQTCSGKFLDKEIEDSSPEGIMKIHRMSPYHHLFAVTQVSVQDSYSFKEFIPPPKHQYWKKLPAYWFVIICITIKITISVTTTCQDKNNLTSYWWRILVIRNI